MRLLAIRIRNFRALEEIDIDLGKHVNVIVGPNAIGKTTILEAVRIAKSTVAARTASEPTQALISIGGVPGYNPQRIITTAIARDPTRPVEIRCRYELDASEIEILASSVPQMIVDFSLRSAGLNFNPAANNIAFLSSPQGQQLLSTYGKVVPDLIDAIRAGKYDCRLDLQLDTVAGRFISGDPVSGMLFGFLDGRNKPSQTIFSYFPADRALPSGEQPVQLGTQDAAQQIESHVSQPQLKYSRLKNTIFSAVVTSRDERHELEKEFERIFGGILKGRTLVSVGVNDFGLLSIRVRDTETKREFDLDGMSSGEKGLILTCMLIGRTIANGGLILLDEPELHLNPAVCKDFLSFLVDNYVVRKNLQAIICSHSPEILAGAFDRDECSLYHLISEKVISKIRYKDNQEISEALSRLGTSESEGLLYKATIFVEGDEDVDLLEVGFGDILRRHKLRDLGGRREVEKQILQLQEAERTGTKLSPKYFIFDRDQTPTNLKDSEDVKILQWDRHCLENYLIEIDILTDLLKDPEIVREPLPNQGEVSKLLRRLAMSQIPEFVARQVYIEYQLDSPGLRTSEIRGKGIREIAKILVARLEQIQSQVGAVKRDQWIHEFEARCDECIKEAEPIWDAKWAEVCDGKRVFEDMFKTIVIKTSPGRFKRRVMQEMRSKPTSNWRSIESLLKRLVQV